MGQARTHKSHVHCLTRRFNFASAPVSWGVEDYPGPAWGQPYEQILDEMVAGGFTGTELGPYGYFPTEAEVLRPVLKKRDLAMLSSFVPVNLADPASASSVIEHIRKVGKLLAALGAPYLVLADAESAERQNLAGRVPSDGSRSLKASQWRGVAQLVAEAERVAADFGHDVRTEVVGTEGTLQVGCLQQTPVVALTRSQRSHDVVTHWLVRFAEAYRREMTDFVSSMREGRTPTVSGRDGRQSVAIAEAAVESQREGRVVRVG